jgi:hypothetical protein
VNLNDNELETAKAMGEELRELHKRGDVTLKIKGVDAFALMACLQLAWRHPQLDQRQKLMIETFARQLQSAFNDYPTLCRVSEMGWNTVHDVPWADKERT